MEKFDAIVVGAGPSGSSCAALLAAKGARVLLIDKEGFPRDKTCGDAIGGKALNVLSELGLESELKERGFMRSSGVIFSSPAGHKVEIPLQADGKQMSGGFVCRRFDFDSIVFSHARKKCKTLEKTEVTDVIFENGKAVGVKAKGLNGAEDSYYAKLVIGADGATSVVARKTGCFSLLPPHSCSAVRGYYSNVGGLRRNIEIHFLPECMPGYFWIFPLSDHEANVGVGMLLSDIAKRRLNLHSVLAACMKNKRFSGRFDSAKLEGGIGGWTLPLASAKRRCSGNGFILLGDAASLVDPFSGEGVGNGMKSAAIAADTLADALKKSSINEEDCRAYEQALWKEIGADVQSSYSIQRLGKHSFLLDFIIGKAERSVWLKNELAGMIANREAKKKATDPMFYLKILFA